MIQIDNRLGSIVDVNGVALELSYVDDDDIALLTKAATVILMLVIGFLFLFDAAKAGVEAISMTQPCSIFGLK